MPHTQGTQGQLQRHRSRTHRHAAVHTDIGGHTSFELRHHRALGDVARSQHLGDGANLLLAQGRFGVRNHRHGIRSELSRTVIVSTTRIGEKFYVEGLSEDNTLSPPQRDATAARRSLHLYQNDGDRQHATAVASDTVRVGPSSG